jgi:hypothetical protein
MIGADPIHNGMNDYGNTGCFLMIQRSAIVSKMVWQYQSLMAAPFGQHLRRLWRILLCMYTILQ